MSAGKQVATWLPPTARRLFTLGVAGEQIGRNTVGTEKRATKLATRLPREPQPASAAGDKGNVRAGGAATRCLQLAQQGRALSATLPDLSRIRQDNSETAKQMYVVATWLPLASVLALGGFRPPETNLKLAFKVVYPKVTICVATGLPLLDCLSRSTVTNRGRFDGVAKTMRLGPSRIGQGMVSAVGPMAKELPLASLCRGLLKISATLRTKSERRGEGGWQLGCHFRAAPYDDGNLVANEFVTKASRAQA